MTHSVAPTLEAQQDMIASVATTLLEIVRALVEYPLRVAVVPVAGPNETVLVITVDPDDVGKVIGRQGRTADSLRSVIHAIGSKRSHRFQLDIRSVGQAPKDRSANRQAPIAPHVGK